MKALSLVGVCVLATCFSISSANAEAFTFTGTGFQSSNRFRFDISGDDFLFRISTSEGPLLVAANCTPGVPCQFEQSYTLAPDFFLVSNTATLDGFTTSALTGRLVVGGTVTPPATGGPFDEFQATIPIFFAGEVTGHFPTSGYPVAFDVVLGGAGTASLSGFVNSTNAVVSGGRFTFSGTGSSQSIPEPGAAFLAAGGIGLLGLLLRRRRSI